MKNTTFEKLFFDEELYRRFKFHLDTEKLKNDLDLLNSIHRYKNNCKEEELNSIAKDIYEKYNFDKGLVDIENIHISMFDKLIREKSPKLKCIFTAFTHRYNKELKPERGDISDLNNNDELYKKFYIFLLDNKREQYLKFYMDLNDVFNLKFSGINLKQKIIQIAIHYLGYGINKKPIIELTSEDKNIIFDSISNNVFTINLLRNTMLYVSGKLKTLFTEFSNNFKKHKNHDSLRKMKSSTFKKKVKSKQLISIIDEIANHFQDILIFEDLFKSFREFLQHQNDEILIDFYKDASYYKIDHYENDDIKKEVLQNLIDNYLQENNESTLLCFDDEHIISDIYKNVTEGNLSGDIFDRIIKETKSLLLTKYVDFCDEMKKDVWKYISILGRYK